MNDLSSRAQQVLAALLATQERSFHYGPDVTWKAVNLSRAYLVVQKSISPEEWRENLKILNVAGLYEQHSYDYGKVMLDEEQDSE